MDNALDRAIAFASLKVPDAQKAEPQFHRSFVGNVEIKGVRLYAKKGWPDLVQVLVGRRWITVIRGPYPSNGVNYSITARGIKSRIRNAKVAQKPNSVPRGY